MSDEAKMYIKSRLRQWGYPADCLEFRVNLDADDRGVRAGIAFYGTLTEENLRKIAGRRSRNSQALTGYRRVKAMRQHRNLLTLFSVLEGDPALAMELRRVSEAMPDHSFAAMGIFTDTAPDDMARHVASVAPAISQTLNVLQTWETLIHEIDDDASRAARQLLMELEEPEPDMFGSTGCSLLVGA